MMLVRRQRKLMGEINVVPYIDVMLVLLIIFMVTAPLLSQGIKVDLPRAAAEPIEPDNLEPHRFAFGIGAVFNFTATLALLTGAAGFGWVLVWVVIALANLNFWANICVGCLMYYQLNRLGVPGFTRAPVSR